jgi:hypothetical protein
VGQGTAGPARLASDGYVEEMSLVNMADVTLFTPEKSEEFNNVTEV